VTTLLEGVAPGRITSGVPKYIDVRSPNEGPPEDWPALACADLLGTGSSQIVVGWRNPDADGKVGIRLFVPTDEAGTGWQEYTVDYNTMACEDLQVADLNNDGKPDIIAAGRDTHNLVVYWNKSERVK